MTLVRVVAVAVTFLVFGAGVSLSDPGDVYMKRSGTAEQTYPPATFPHWVHSIRYRCFACHPAVFSMTTFETETGKLKQDRKPFAAPKDKKNKGEEPKKEKEPGESAEPAKAKATSREQLMHGPQACGLCHNGKPAFRIEFSACGRCHVPKEQ